MKRAEISSVRSRWASFLLAALVAVPTLAAGLTPEQVVMLRSVRDLAVSPDGDRIAYVLEVPRQAFEEEDGPAWRELHVVGREGASRPFVGGEVSVSDPAFTADGGSITFLAKRGEDEAKALYAIPVDGGEARKLVGSSEDLESYDLSADGRWVAFLAKAEEPEQRKKEKEKGFDRKIVDEELRPLEVWIQSLEEEAAEARKVEIEGSAREIHWSPDGALLALKVSPTPLVDDGYYRTRVRVVDAASGELRGRVDNPGKLGDIAWSPDGRHLALVAAEDEHDPREGRLMVAPAAGGAMRDLLPGLEGHVVALAWKDAETLLYVAHDGVEARLGEVSLGGGGSTLLAPGGPIWTEIRHAASGDLALLGSTPEHPAEVFHLPTDGAEAGRRTNSNPWLSDARLARQEVFRHEARDGLALEGILMRPLDEQAGRRYPLVMIVHGGPEAHQSNGWLTTYSNPGQLLAARGFAVFYPNYRGSTGRGVAFSKLGQGDMGGKEFDDLVDAIDDLVATGLVDEDKVGITGGSYGGYASAWGATYYSERYAAAVMFVGISDQTAKMGTSDIINELYLVHELAWPWEQWEHFLERSPVRYVEKARTPILIAHGDSDPRVHPAQSLELFRYLKVLGKTPVRLVNYPGEKHGNRRQASRIDYMLRLVRWMEHYLQGPGGEPPPPELDYSAFAGAGASEESSDPASSRSTVQRNAGHAPGTP